MTTLPRRSTVLGTLAAASALLLAAPTPGSALVQLRDAASAAEVTAPLVALLSLIGWVLTGWLWLTVALTAAACLPGLAGAVCTAVSRRVAPIALRRAIEVGLGLTVAVGTLGAAPAAAGAAAPAGAPAPAASLDSAAQAPAAGPDLDWPAAPSPAAPAPAARVPAAPGPAPAPAHRAREVVVAPGDSLWELAERDLTARSGSAPTDADVARTWPAWWAANRDAVGADPHLIQPGIRLTPPAADGVASPASS